MSEYRELLLGCGHQRNKILVPPGTTSEWQRMETLDINQECRPDWLCDLDRMRNNKWVVIGRDDNYEYHQSAADYFVSNRFDEIHAYEVLEHIGEQGEYSAFFNHFSEIWRLLKPDGFLCATVPSRYSPWLWGDPGHRRAILPESLIFLDQTTYMAQLGRTAMSDYRGIYKADFEIIRSTDDRIFHSFILKAIKPSRYLG